MTISIIDLMTDPALFGEQFGGDSWRPWRALMAGFYNLPMSDDEAETFKRLTGRDSAPDAEADEGWFCLGRRAGKSNIAGLIAIYESCFKDHSKHLSAGEWASVICIAADRKQARTVKQYISGLLNSNPMLAKLIVKEDSESIELSNRCRIQINSASFRTTRGFTAACVIADELAYMRSDESANPDAEILNALRPALASLDGKLICISSPYRKTGELWNTYKKYFGVNSPILVAQADSLSMNPSLSRKVVERAYERDPAAAAAEYGAQFRNDISSFIDRDRVDACVRPGPLEIPYNRHNRYFGFVDAAGGGKDEYSYAVSHREGDRIIIDCLRARCGKPADITAEAARLFKTYAIKSVQGDRYSGSWVADEFAKHAISYRPVGLTKSDLYVELLPAINGEVIELPPDPKAINQLANLERRTARSGKDSIDHAAGASDDRANSIAGASWICKRPVFDTPIVVEWAI